MWVVRLSQISIISSIPPTVTTGNKNPSHCGALAVMKRFICNKSSHDDALASTQRVSFDEHTRGSALSLIERVVL